MISYFDISRLAGWIEPQVIPILSQFNDLQNDIKGHIVEIGVHHGKFFLVLASCQREEEYAFAIDLFENQSENISGSGFGSLPTLANNLANVLPNASVCILRENSIRIPFKNNIMTANDMQVRLFSVDGGHSYGEAYSDLCLADSVLHDEGIIILDDFQHKGWDDVNAAGLNFLKNHPYTPLAIGGNKLFLCKRTAYDKYINLPSLTMDEYLDTCGHEFNSLKKSKHIAQTYKHAILFSENHFLMPPEIQYNP